MAKARDHRPASDEWRWVRADLIVRLEAQQAKGEDFHAYWARLVDALRAGEAVVVPIWQVPPETAVYFGHIAFAHTMVIVEADGRLTPVVETVVGNEHHYERPNGQPITPKGTQ